MSLSSSLPHVLVWQRPSFDERTQALLHDHFGDRADECALQLPIASDEGEMGDAVDPKQTERGTEGDAMRTSVAQSTPTRFASRRGREAGGRAPSPRGQRWLLAGETDGGYVGTGIAASTSHDCTPLPDPLFGPRMQGTPRRPDHAVHWRRAIRTHRTSCALAGSSPLSTTKLTRSPKSFSKRSIAGADSRQLTHHGA